MGFDSQAFVSHPAPKVWEFIIDLKNNGPKWLTGGVSEVHKVSAGDIGVGTVFRAKAHGRDIRYIVTAFDDGRRFTLTSKQGRATVVHTYSVEPKGDGCVVELSATCNLEGFWKVTAPLVNSRLRRSDASHPQRIKLAVEQSSENE